MDPHCCDIGQHEPYDNQLGYDALVKKRELVRDYTKNDEWVVKNADLKAKIENQKAAMEVRLNEKRTHILHGKINNRSFSCFTRSSLAGD